MEELLAKYFSSNTTEEETREVEAWRTTHQEEFFAHKRVWVDHHETGRPAPARLNEILDRETRQVTLWKSTYMRYAASIVLLIAVGIAAYFYFSDSVLDAGMVRQVKLEDGTKVMLYKDASLTWIEEENKRVVEIQGKVYFDVRRDEERPFEIYTPEAKIVVLGTSFIVDSEQAHTTEVIVESGVVSFSQNPSSYGGRVTSIKLKEGDMGIIRPQAKGLIKRKNRDENYLAWANKKLIFKDTDLMEVGSLIEEVYGYEVEFDNTQLGACRLTATYDRKKPKEIARLISETFGFSYAVEGQVIRFSGPGC